MRNTTSRGLLTIIIGGVFMLSLAQATLQAKTASRVTEFKLANGMLGVVIPDNRAPVVTHMVWYRVGSADEPRGVSGIAHFLEHLMFKSTDKIASGEFSKIVSRLGGNDNAFTTSDATAYFQRVAKDRLAKVMEMEADRMVNLRLTEKEVLTERDVILEERRSRIENSPSSIMDEQNNAVLFSSHPYAIPVIGWMHEMARLSREDALTFYKHHYAPNNAILVVAGDVTAEEVQKLAEATFGKLPANSDIKPRTRPTAPEPLAARRVELDDPRAGRPSVQRYYTTPSYITAKPGEAEALDLLMKVAASGPTSRIYKRLVVEKQVASSAGGYYSGSPMDYGKIVVYGVPAENQTLDRVEQLIDEVLAEVRDKGVTDAELERAKKTYMAEYIYESDNQMTLARRYGWGLITGSTIADIEDWPDRIAKVTPAEIKAAADKYLDIRRSVTGRLIPAAPSATGATKVQETPRG